MSKKQRNVQVNMNKPTNRKRLSVWVWVFVGVAIFVFIYCIVCNVINNLEDMPRSVKIIFGLSDFANTAIGALLGFGASLLLENYLIDSNKEKAIDNIATEMTQMCLYIFKIYSKDRKIADKQVSCEEIKMLLCKFDDRIKGPQDNFKYNKDTDSKGLSRLKKRVVHCRYTIYLPIWDSVLQNGDLLRFKDKGYFECLINIYTRLNKFKAQIDAFDSSINEEELFLFLFELYSDAQKLRAFIKNNEEHIQAICQYLTGEGNIKLKEEFLSEFNFN